MLKIVGMLLQVMCTLRKITLQEEDEEEEEDITSLDHQSVDSSRYIYVP